MSDQNLEAFKNQLLAEMKNMSFHDHEASASDGVSEIFWSIGPSYSIVPLELEMCGLVPSRITAKEPSVKRNAQKIHCCGGQVVSIEYFNDYGIAHAEERFFYSESRYFSLKTNYHKEKLWLKMSELELGKTVRAGRVDHDLEFWTFQYEWSEDTVKEITSLCSNSLPGVVLYPEYMDSELTRLYFVKEGEQVDVLGR